MWVVPTLGSVSLQACTWAWDKGINSFPVQSRWTLRILLNDAYNNSVSSANGADDSGNLGFQWVITFRNQADQSLVPAAIMPQPQVVDNLSNGYYSLVLISFVEGKYTITVANDKNQTVANMPASFQVTKGMCKIYRAFSLLSFSQSFYLYLNVLVVSFRFWISHRIFFLCKVDYPYSQRICWILSYLLRPT
jgi:hypothetical protein